jgi:hypothetical protein
MKLTYLSERSLTQPHSRLGLAKGKLLIGSTSLGFVVDLIPKET